MTLFFVRVCTHSGRVIYSEKLIQLIVSLTVWANSPFTKWSFFMLYECQRSYYYKYIGVV